MIIKLLLFTPNITKTLGLFTEGLGLKCTHLSETFAEIQDSQGTVIMLSKSPSLAYTYSGFTPIIMFQTERFEACLENVKKYGCQYEGEPQTNDEIGKIAYLKSPEGLSFALKQIKTPETPQSTPPTDHPATEELKRFIQKLNL